jgi:hypothetical protein
MQKAIFLFLFIGGCLWAKQIPDKVLICGIGRNIEKAISNTIQSATELGSRFSDEFLMRKKAELDTQCCSMEKLYAPYWFEKVRKVQKDLRENATLSERFHSWISER